MHFFPSNYNTSILVHLIITSQRNSRFRKKDKNRKQGPRIAPQASVRSEKSPQPCCHQGDSQGSNLKGGNWKTPRYWESDFCSILQAIGVHMFCIFFSLPLHDKITRWIAGTVDYYAPPQLLFFFSCNTVIPDWIKKAHFNTWHCQTTACDSLSNSVLYRAHSKNWEL